MGESKRRNLRPGKKSKNPKKQKLDPKKGEEYRALISLNLKEVIKIDEDIDTVQECINDIFSCGMSAMRLIYEAANMAVDIVDDICDYQIVNVDVGLGALGLGFGPTNCELLSYGLHGTGFLANAAGGLLIAVG